MLQKYHIRASGDETFKSSNFRPDIFTSNSSWWIRPEERNRWIRRNHIIAWYASGDWTFRSHERCKPLYHCSWKDQTFEFVSLSYVFLGTFVGRHLSIIHRPTILGWSDSDLEWWRGRIFTLNKVSRKKTREIGRWNGERERERETDREEQIKRKM